MELSSRLMSCKHFLQQQGITADKQVFPTAIGGRSGYAMVCLETQY